MQKVLVIEDDRTLHKAFRRLFEGEGLAVELAADGAAGLAAFRAAAPILVILDLKLPKVPGREVCRQIREESPDLPIIVLSAATEEIDKVLLPRAGR